MARINPLTGKPFGSEDEVVDKVNPVTGQRFAGKINPLTQLPFGTQQPTTSREPTGPLGATFDFLLRTQYASAKLVDTLLTDDAVAIGSAFAAAGKELIDPKDRLGFEDVIKHVSPDFAAANPNTTILLGLAGNIFLDPLTYLTVGAGAGAKLTVRGARYGLRRAGAEAAETIGKRAMQTVTLSRRGEKRLRSLMNVERAAARETAGTAGAHARTFLAGPEGASSTILEINERAIRETAEQRLSRIVTNPRLRSGLVDEGGIKMFGRTLVAGRRFSEPVRKAVKWMERVTGVDDLHAAVGNLPTVQAVTRAFSRNRQLPEEYVSIRQGLEAEMIRMEREIASDAERLFGGLSKADRRGVGEFLGRVNDLTRLEGERVGRALTPDEGARIFNDALSHVRLSPEQFAAMSTFRRTMADVAELELSANLLSHTLLNYSPRVWKQARSGALYARLRRGLRERVANPFGPGQSRAFKTEAEALREGFVPVRDLLVLYSNRVIQSRRALAVSHFNNSVRAIAGELDDVAKRALRGDWQQALAHTVELDRLPKILKEDITFVGEGLYNRGALPETNEFLRLYDGVLSIFRKSATTARPAFGARQLLSNQLQQYLVLGARSFGALDPRIIGDTMSFLNSGRARFGLRSNLGHIYSPEELTSLVSEHGIVRNIALEGIGGERQGSLRFARSVAREIDLKRGISGLVGTPAADSGMARFLVGLTRYMDWPAKIEDFARTSMFFNGLRIGHSPQAAADLVQKALFDYMHGLSAWETRLARRIIPFYSFQRFALPMVAEMTMKHPGRIANLEKTADAFFAAWNKFAGGDSLDDADRNAIPGWLLEQPHAFERLIPEHQAVFRTFNNFSPLDAYSFVETDEHGEFDMRGTLIKGGLAQTAPLIKLPLEYLIEQDMFTGRVLSKPRRIGDVRPDNLLTNILTLAAGQATGSMVGAAGGQVAGRIAGEIPGLSERILKTTLGWEEGINAETGERQVWVNPMMIHTATSVFPVLSEAFKISKDEHTPLERTMQLVFGIGTVKLDLAKQAEYKRNRLLRQRAELVAEIRRAEREKRLTSFDRAMEDLNELDKVLQEDLQILGDGATDGGS